jgi:hypothetical protein
MKYIVSILLSMFFLALTNVASAEPKEPHWPSFDSFPLTLELAKLSPYAVGKDSDFYRTNYTFNCASEKLNYVSYDDAILLDLLLGKTKILQGEVNAKNAEKVIPHIKKLVAPYLKKDGQKSFLSLTPDEKTKIRNQYKSLCSQESLPCEAFELYFVLELNTDQLGPNFKAHAQCINYADLSFLRMYTTSYYLKLNHKNLLKSKTAQKYMSYLRHRIFEVVAKFKIYEGLVYVGTYLNPEEIKSAHIGEKLNFSGFLSGSIDNTFIQFARNTVVVVKNKSGRNIAPYNPIESEVIFQDPEFLIREIKIDEKGRTWFFCDQIK